MGWCRPVSSAAVLLCSLLRRSAALLRLRRACQRCLLAAVGHLALLAGWSLLCWSPRSAAWLLAGRRAFNSRSASRRGARAPGLVSALFPRRCSALVSVDLPRSVGAVGAVASAGLLALLLAMLALVLPLLVCWLLCSAGLLCSLLPAGLGSGSVPCWLVGSPCVAAVLLAPGLLWASLSCELGVVGSLSALCRRCWSVSSAGWLAGWLLGGRSLLCRRCCTVVVVVARCLALSGLLVAVCSDGRCSALAAAACSRHVPLRAPAVDSWLWLALAAWSTAPNRSRVGRLSCCLAALLWLLLLAGLCCVVVGSSALPCAHRRLWF